MNKYIAEALGTFGLTFAVLISVAGSFPVATPVIAALTLCLFVYTVGPISGAHLNPAITVGLFMINKIGLRDGIAYIIAQLVGAWLALKASLYLAPEPSLTVAATITVGFAEFIGAFFFAFGVAAAVSGKVSQRMAGLVVGGSLLMGISLAASNSNGILNPAVALGLGSFNLMYAAGPVVGAIFGMLLYRFLGAAKD